jgi:4-diphosphocytidyl-2-C-methyl-D-erythritol kinase
MVAGTFALPANPAISIDCPAKVNLALGVGAAPIDRGGLHPIASWMATIRLSDHLTLVASPDSHSRFDISFDVGVTYQVDWPVIQDHTFRAHALLEQHLECALPVHLALRKRIAPGGGLGGGSSDAAATLVALRNMFQLGVSNLKLFELGLQLGSDVGFFIEALLGTASSLVSGLGERVEPLELHQPLYLVLVFPGFPMATKQVYAAFDDLDKASDTAALESKLRTLAGCTPLESDLLFNDLTAPAIALNARLGHAMDEVEEALGVPVHLSGSGSTFFALAPNAAAAGDMAQVVSAMPGLAAHATSTGPGPSVH